MDNAIMSLKKKNSGRNQKKWAEIRKRTISRLMAIQILYQYDFFNSQNDLTTLKEATIDNYALSPEHDITSYREKIDLIFLDNLLEGLTIDKENIDADISTFLKSNWTIEKLNPIIKQIIRFATFELKFLTNIPFKVIIDEYVDISASFFEKKKITFVNGILENIAKKFRSQETAANLNPIDSF